MNDVASRQWDELLSRLEVFLAAWKAADAPPDLALHLPEQPGAMRRLVLVELIKIDLEQRLQRQSKIPHKPLEEYAREFPELIDPATKEPPPDLIYEEFHLCRAHGRDTPAAEWGARFPGSWPALTRLLAANDATVSTALAPGPAVVQPSVGDRVDDFDLLGELGAGAFASVFLARQVSMQRLVALKVSADKGSEPQTLAQLDHPNIVRVYDQRRLPERRLRLLYMQYAPGGTLADVVTLAHKTPAPARCGELLVRGVENAMTKSGQAVNEDAPWRRRAGALPWPEVVCRLGAQLAAALGYAHQQGVLHRDVKPANVLLSADGVPKLADFNISFGANVTGATPAAYFGGSLAYMSPEQLEACNPHHQRRPESLDGRSDLYSLAVLLWELLHGQRPFADPQLAEGWVATLEEMAWARQFTKPTSPMAVPAARDARLARVEQVLLKCLSPDPAARHATGAELSRELLLCLHGRTWDLFHDLAGGWREFARRHPLLIIIPVNLLPNAFAGGYNFWFNYSTLILGEGPLVKHAFAVTSPIINGIAFPVGVFLGSWYAWPAVTTIWRVARRLPCDENRLALARGRLLWLGHIIAAIGVAEWLISGIAFPLAIHLLAGQFSAKGYLHFFLSLVACGLIAAAFPFLGTTWVSLRVFYPALLGSTTPDAAERRQLEALPQQATYYAYTAAIVPFVAAFISLASYLDERPENRLVVLVLILVSLIGMSVAFYLSALIHRDVAALSVATRPVGSFGSSTDTVESL